MGSLSAAFHHAERAPRVTSSLTAESPTIRSFQTILGVDTRTLATRVLRARKTRKRIAQTPLTMPMMHHTSVSTISFLMHRVWTLLSPLLSCHSYKLGLQIPPQ